MEELDIKIKLTGTKEYRQKLRKEKLQAKLEG